MILDEELDARLNAAKRFEIKRMTREEVMFFAERNENMYLARYQTSNFPAEPVAVGINVKDVTQKDAIKPKPDQDSCKMDNLYFEKTVFRRRGRPAMGRGNIFLPDTALSDTEYAILKEAEESRRALEKLQKYMSNANNQRHAVSVNNNQTHSVQKMFKSSTDQECIRFQPEIVRQDRYALTEDEIAARNLTNELKKQDLDNILKSAGLPTDLPIYVDDGNGNYVDLDVDMAKMITEQQVKYRLVQGVIMANDDQGNHHFSNPANVFIPEQKLKSMGLLTNEEAEERMTNRTINSGELDFEEIIPQYEDLQSETVVLDSDVRKTERKPFVVKEIIRLNRPKKKLIPNLRHSLNIKRNMPFLKIVNKEGNDSRYFS